MTCQIDVVNKQLVEITHFQKDVDDLQTRRYPLDVDGVYNMWFHVKNNWVYTQYFNWIVKGTLMQISKTCCFSSHKNNAQKNSQFNTSQKTVTFWELRL